MKKILYIDMDGVVVDFESGLDRISPEIKKEYQGEPDNIPGIYGLMDEKEGAIEAVKKLSEKYEIYFLSSAPWENPSAWSDKVIWLQKRFGEWAKNRLIISKRKDLNLGDYLIDDREKNGAKEFKGELLLFGSEKFSNWDDVLKYLL